MPASNGPNNLSDVTPGEHGWPGVDFRGLIRPESTSDCDRYAKELSFVFGTSRKDVERVLVVETYGGYSKATSDKAIFGIELCLFGDLGYETHIVKLGTEEEVGRDADNWNECTRGREVASRIFAPAQKRPIRKGGRVAVIYRDAYTLFGPTGQSDDVIPHNLETVVHNAVCTNTVDPRSVERAIAHIFIDLTGWFYHGAKPSSADAAKFYSKELVSAKQGKDALDLWGRDVCLELRRDALWLFCGRDRADHNHDGNPARYLDPAELVAWALKTGKVPETLVGRGHGDLHGRNVLLGCRRRAAEYPAVFDYGGMGKLNALAWDFAKLETELKVRLLEKLYRYDDAHSAVERHASWIWQKPGSKRPGPARDRDATTCRAERLRFFFVIEEMLAERTEWITNAGHASAWQPPGGRKLNAVTTLDRLLTILLRIRQEAALALGFSVGRIEEWRDEYYFALAVYGLVNARWKTYTKEQQESALVSAGVAAAHARFARQAIVDQCNLAAPPGEPYPSYRVPLAHAHRYWKEMSMDKGKKLLDGLKASYSHAVPLIAEHALFCCDAGDFAQVQNDLRALSAKAVAFADVETLTRLGRTFKEMGDQSWDACRLPFEQLDGRPPVQFYRWALEPYEHAYGLSLSNNYFPGINVAALALLIGDKARATEVATKLRDECEHITVPREDLYWLFATEGDAALILEDQNAALTFYRDAIRVLQKGEEQYAVSSYRQLLRLRGPLGGKLVNPVLQLFDADPRLGKVMRKEVKWRIPG